MPPSTTRLASCVRDRLYLSDYSTANSDGELERLGVTHIISVLERTFPSSERVPPANRLVIPVADKSSEDILTYLDATTAFIRERLAEDEANVILVHCMQGISRSATVVCAYLIATEGLEAHEAVDAVQEQRHVVCPNLGFRLQLAKYAEQYPKPNSNSSGKGIIHRVRRLLTPKPTAPSVAVAAS